MNTILIALATDLSKLLAKQTAITVRTKIDALKQDKDLDTVKQTYNDLLNDLLQDRSDALNIAQSYKEELEKVEISDDDIQHLQHTITRIIKIMQPSISKNSTDIEAKSQLDALKKMNELINIDTLKTMQLLGFNYKKAIGEPLTTIVRNYLLSLAPSTDSTNEIHKVLSPEMVEMLKSKNAFDNFNKLINSKV